MPGLLYRAFTSLDHQRQSPNKRGPMSNTIDLLKTRRSVKPMEMSGPGPSPAELETILTIGAPEFFGELVKGQMEKVATGVLEAYARLSTKTSRRRRVTRHPAGVS